LFTQQSLQPTPSTEAGNGNVGHSLVENVMLSDTLLWKGNTFLYECLISVMLAIVFITMIIT